MTNDAFLVPLYYVFPDRRANSCFAQFHLVPLLTSRYLDGFDEYSTRNASWLISDKGLSNANRSSMSSNFTLAYDDARRNNNRQKKSRLRPGANVFAVARRPRFVVVK